MTACYWLHRKQMSGHAGFMIIGHKVTHPEALLHLASPSGGRTPNFTASCPQLWKSWVCSGLHRRSPPADTWMSGSCRGAVKPLVSEPHHSSQKSTKNSPGCGTPLLDESVAAHLYPPTAIGWLQRLPTHPSLGGRLQRFTTRWSCRSFRPNSSGAWTSLAQNTQHSENCAARLTFTHHQDHGPGNRQVHSRLSGARAPLVVDDDVDQGHG